MPAASVLEVTESTAADALAASDEADGVAVGRRRANGELTATSDGELGRASVNSASSVRDTRTAPLRFDLNVQVTLVSPRMLLRRARLKRCQKTITRTKKKKNGRAVYLLDGACRCIILFLLLLDVMSAASSPTVSTCCAMESRLVSVGNSDARWWVPASALAHEKSRDWTRQQWLVATGRPISHSNRRAAADAVWEKRAKSRLPQNVRTSRQRVWQYRHSEAAQRATATQRRRRCTALAWRPTLAVARQSAQFPRAPRAAAKRRETSCTD